MPQIDPSIYDGNLAALSVRQPELAAAVEAAGGPEARLVEGRDGTLTFVLCGEGAEAWLGGTSMPGVTAEELFRGFAGGHENVILPGIMSGGEVRRLARRFGRHAAIFVIEPSDFHLQLVLRLYDFQALIARGQIVFLLQGEFESQLLSLLERFPGYMMPTRMLTIPHRTAAEHADLQRRLERAAGQAARHQAELLAALGSSLKQVKTPGSAGQTSDAEVGRRRLGAEGPGKTPVPHLSPQAAGVGEAAGSETSGVRRVAVLSTDASDFTLRDAQGIAAALEELGWAGGCCIPDLPARCHAVARMQCLAMARAGAVIFVNSAPASLRPLLPQDMPVIAWFFAAGRVPALIEQGIGPAGLFVATSAAQQVQLLAAGVPEMHVCYAGVAAAPPLPVSASESALSADRAIRPSSPPRRRRSSETCQAGREKSASQDGLAFDVAIVGDVPDDRAEAAGITLSTHASLWRECVKLAAERATKDKADTRGSGSGCRTSGARGAPGGAELLSAAEERCGVRLSDAKIRGEMARKIEERALPAAFARQLGRELAARFAVSFCGANWAGVHGTKGGDIEARESGARSSGATGTVDIGPPLQVEEPPSRPMGCPNPCELARRARWIVLPFFSTGAVQTAVDVLAAGGRVALRAGHAPLAECHPELREIVRFVPTFTSAAQLMDVLAKTRAEPEPDISGALERVSLKSAVMRIMARVAQP